MRRMLSPRKKEGGSCASAVVSVGNRVTTNIEDVDGDMSEESHSHATSISNFGSLR